MITSNFDIVIHLRCPHSNYCEPMQSPEGKWEDLSGLYIFISNANNRIPLNIQN